ncbi:MAG: DUF2279 domain-containing protein [Bacteroidota bacterium]
MKRSIQIACLFIVLLCSTELSGQGFKQYLMPVDTFNKGRFWTLTGGGIVAYTGIFTALSQAWYADFPRRNFHFFNDMGEWKDMDKVGHLFSTYFESKWGMGAYRWAGLDHKSSVWAGVIVGQTFQTTVEVLDGFSSEWGFSWGDVAFNTAGTMLFAGQEWLWREQRIILKWSAHKVNHPDFIVQSVDPSGVEMRLQDRVDDLYGTSLAELFLKDYNGQTVWLSVNPGSFIQKENSKFPKWLNVAFGYGAENLYGGFSNAWEDDDGNVFAVFPDEFPPYRQYYFSFDVDLSRIPVKKRGWGLMLRVLNIFKIPGPTLEINSLGEAHFRPFFF